jgi:hypothetical protein
MAGIVRSQTQTMEFVCLFVFFFPFFFFKQHSGSCEHINEACIP